MTETATLKQTMLQLAKLPALRFWRNNTGQAWMGRAITLAAGQKIVAQDGDVLIRAARPVRFGLPGSSDLVGLAGPHGRFLAVEAKALTGAQAAQQAAFQQMVQAHGGVYVLVRDPTTAVEQVADALRK